MVPYQLVALDSATGETRWTRPSVGCFICSPAVAKGILYVGAGPASGRRLLALDARSGAARWSFRPQAGTDFSWSASPAVAGSRVFQAAFVGRGTKKYSLYAFTASTGKRVWKAPVGSSELLTSSSPAVANGVVLLTSPPVNASTPCAPQTARDSGRGRSRRARPRPRWPAGVVYFGAGLTVYGLDARTGKTLWRGHTTADPSDPAVTGGTLYVGSGDGVTRAYRLPAG